MVYIEPEIQEKIIKLHIQDGRTITSLSDEFGYSRGVISRLIKKYREEAKQNEQRVREIAELRWKDILTFQWKKSLICSKKAVSGKNLKKTHFFVPNKPPQAKRPKG